MLSPWQQIAKMDWNTTIDLLCGLLMVTILYRMGIRLGWKKYASDQPFPLVAVLRMDVAMLIFYLAVGSPLDELGDSYLFSAHMVQHSILIFLLPPLILAALPPFVYRPLAENPTTRKLFAFLVHPVTALASFNIVFAAWHIPILYELALRDLQVHQAEHLMFLLAAIQMWWPVVSPSPDFPRLTPGSRSLYLFLMSVTQIPLFAFLVMTGEQYYPTYAAARRLFPISPLEDQGIGGIIMKILGEVVFGSYLMLAFIEWYRNENARPAQTEPTPPVVAEAGSVSS